MQVGTNGIISFGSEFETYTAQLFPYGQHIIAPYWTDNDATLYGRVSWEAYSSTDSQISSEIIAKVTNFIRIDTSSKTFNGNFVLVANWSEMHPYPAGQHIANAEPYFNMVIFLGNMLCTIYSCSNFHRIIPIKLCL